MEKVKKLIDKLYKTRSLEVNEYKYTLYIEKNIQDFLLNENELDGNEIRIYKNNLRQLVDFARFNLAQSSKEIRKMVTLSPFLMKTRLMH